MPGGGCVALRADGGRVYDCTYAGVASCAGGVHAKAEGRTRPLDGRAGLVALTRRRIVKD